jgi:hypothetical protein
MLNTIESNKNRAIQWANVGLGQQQIISGIASSSAAASSQPLMTSMGTQQYSAGLRESYSKDVLGGYSSWLGSQSNERMSSAQNAMNAAIVQANNENAIELARGKAWSTGINTAYSGIMGKSYTGSSQ